MRTAPQMSEVSWWVAVLSQKGASLAAGRRGTPVSPDSGVRVFVMKP